MKIDRVVLRASWQTWISNGDRPRAGPAWLQWMWTLLFCAGLALVFTVLGAVVFSRDTSASRSLAGWAYWYGTNLIVCLAIGIAIHLLFTLGSVTVARPESVRRWRPWQRTLFFSITPMLGVAIGWPLGVTLAGHDLLAWIGSRDGGRIIGGSIAIAALITFLINHFFAAKSRQLEAERSATEARLMLLQAQIEPHFLFNTLANVHSLMEHDLPRARTLLESFTDHLRSTLGALRGEDGTVGDEFERVRSYLALMQMRMEDRLRFELRADATARGQPLPALLLQPLVENAVVHGLEPAIDGGTVRVAAQVDGGHLVLEVNDDGRGLDAAPVRSARMREPGAGVALDNIRQRLLARYGPAARLELEPAHPGTRARITVPIEGPAA